MDQSPKNRTKGEVNSHSQAKVTEYYNFHIVKTTYWFQPNFANDHHHGWSQHTYMTNVRWRMAAILKNRQIPMS